MVTSGNLMNILCLNSVYSFFLVFWCWHKSDLVKYELRVTSCELISQKHEWKFKSASLISSTNYEFKSMISTSRVTTSTSRVTGSNSRVMSSNFLVMSSNLRVTGLNPRIASWNPWVTSSNLRFTSLNLKFQESLQVCPSKYDLSVDTRH